MVLLYFFEFTIYAGKWFIVMQPLTDSKEFLLSWTCRKFISTCKMIRILWNEYLCKMNAMQKSCIWQHHKIQWWFKTTVLVVTALLFIKNFWPIFEWWCPIISTLRGFQWAKNEVPRSLRSRDMASFRFRRPKKAKKGPKSPATKITVTFDWFEIEPSYFQGW